MVKAKEVGNGWLSRTIVAKLETLRSIDSIKWALIIREGVINIDVKAMGGILVALIFPTIDEMKDMLKGGKKCWLNSWFVEVNKWSPNAFCPPSRMV